MKGDRKEEVSNSESASFQADKYRLALSEQTNMWQAAAKGDIPALKGFLEKGADVNVVEGNLDTTPLLCAVSEGQIEAARFLIENGADLDVQDLFGSTPMMLAVMQSNTQMVTLLLEKGADVTIKDFRDPPETALEMAYKVEDETIIGLLRRAGANR
jgi:ankyrin repeat protein